MLGKLLKYEIKATARNILPLYGALILLALINKIFIGREISAGYNIYPVGISIVLYGVIMVAMFITTFIVMILRFYKNLLSDEGYLMFTLPVKTWHNITAKLITSIMWIVLGMIITFATLIFLAFNKDSIMLFNYRVASIIRDINGSLGIKGYMHILSLMLIGITQLASGILMLYTAMSIGHLFKSQRVLASFGAVIVLDLLSKFIGGTGIFTVAFSMNNFHVTNALMTESIISKYILWIPVIINIFFSAAYFILTNYILSKRLNLE